MPTGPPDPSPPVEADFGPSHDAITAELLDLTWQFLTHAPLQSALNSASSLPTTVSTPSPASGPRRLRRATRDAQGQSVACSVSDVYPHS
jgi:hypothetical protein